MPRPLHPTASHSVKVEASRIKSKEQRCSERWLGQRVCGEKEGHTKRRIDEYAEKKTWKLVNKNFPPNFKI